jgi:hypothetical protein
MADDVRMKTELSRTLSDVDRGPVKDAILSSLNLMDNALRGRVAEAPFSIAPAGAWEISDDGLEWDDEWDFYVVPTSRVDDVCGPQKSITLSAVCDRLGGEPCTVAELEFFHPLCTEALTRSSAENPSAGSFPLQARPRRHRAQGPWRAPVRSR